jgi:predicted SAM-dependent methyltransferase
VKVVIRKKNGELSMDSKKIKINLACGNVGREGFIGVDISPTEQCDLICNLEQYPWRYCKKGDESKWYRWDMNSVDEIWCNNYLEHVTDLISFWNETYSILKPNGKMVITAPYWSSVRCWQDPTHKQAISEATFLYVNQEWLKNNHLEHYGINAYFDVKIRLILAPEWMQKSVSIEERERAMRYNINVITDIQAEMIAIK